MRIVVFGAAGSTGRELVEQALAAGHQVVAAVRRPEKVQPRAGLTVVQADVADPEAVRTAVAGSDAVFSVVGGKPSRQPVSLYSTSARNIIDAMHEYGVKRLMVVSSVILEPGWRPSNAFFFNNVIDPLVNRVMVRTTHDDMRRMEQLVRDSGLDWTIARPSGLFSNQAPTRYEVQEDQADGLFTAREDLAAAMLAQLTGDTFVRRAMAVITTAVKPNVAKLIWREAIMSK
ncbi:SDR family oxidoreductase [Kribbella qitaiheensis]|uniref:SDR family oxidoreductase n=1 Tax=Kribbella qitaiheensis TaxID=1544730 RepID=A0A7G6WTF2_9ACTN|nr:SDR family oxidoreductase [Kribbella qitaiheensis]QNE17267.1 SDR family oxidoreductase [Kribbella qitaiheensis]